MPKVVYTVESVNQRLKDKGSKARVALRGKSALNLQATLPAKPFSRRKGRYQQYIPVGLTYPSGSSVAAKKEQVRVLKICEAEAEQLHTDIIYKRFSWDNYDVVGTVQGTPAAKLIAQFEKHYRQRNSLQERTWKNNWQRYFDYLPQKAPVTAELMTKAIAESSSAGTGTRQTFCQKYKALAKFAGIEVDFSEFGRTDKSKDSYEPREIPSDGFIIQHRPDADGRYEKSQLGWQWIYSMLFIAGLRPHEAFFCEWSTDGLEILQGKTGPRTVLYEVMELLRPSFIDEWEMKTIKLPSINAQAAYEDGSLGRKINNYFGKRKIPIKGYDPRHAFALAGIDRGVPPATMALMMGHSELEHIRTYRQHIDRGRSKITLQRLLNAD